MKSKFILSAITGFFFGLFTYFILKYLSIDNSFLFSVFSGLLFYLMLFVFLIIYEKNINKRYSQIEKEITSPVFYKTNGNFILCNGKMKNGNIYFCEAGIVCVCLEEKPYTLDEILLQNIDHYEFDNIHLNIFTNDGRLFVITTADAKKVVDVLKEKGWVE